MADDPLAEAMSMLDAVTNGESFEDFAIDSDDDDNLQDLDLGNDFLGESEVGDESEEKNGATNLHATKTSDSDTAKIEENITINGTKKPSENDFEHPLQMTGAGGIDPLSQFSPDGAAQEGDARTSPKGDDMVATGVRNSSLTTTGGETTSLDQVESTVNIIISGEFS